MLSRLRDLARMLRILDAVDAVSFSVRRFFRLVEMLALPVLFLGALTLVVITVTRAITWSSMTHLIAVPKDRIATETQILISLGQVLGGGFILTGLYFTGKSYVLARRGQFAERLGTAIEGLGDDSLQRRIGSILSLGAMVSDERGDTYVVINVLCSFVRTATASEDYRAEYSNTSPRADIQAAISVLAQARRRIAWWRWIEIDLRKSVLSYANFDNGDFRRAKFQDCLLTNSSFFRSRLARANFSRATLSGSNFNQTDLRNTSFFRSVSPSCTFRRANIIQANLARANLKECSFDDARIIETTFSQSEMTQSTFHGSRVRGGDYHKVDAQIIESMNIKKLSSLYAKLALLAGS